MKIGNTDLRHGLMLAPLAGFTDLSFRSICAEYGAEYAVSEMISAKAVVMNNKKTFELARIGSLPTAIQLFGSEPYAIAYAAELFSSQRAKELCGEMPVAIDINMGCPMHKIVSNGEGSALLKDLRSAEKVICAAVAASKLPVTVKIRSGWDGEHINAPDAAKMAEACGAAAITLHARTKEQLYSGKADHSVTERVVKAVKIPVVGNGDVNSPQDVKKLKEMGCAAVMIGRAAVGDPWIFSRIIASEENTEFVSPTPKERTELAIRHLEHMVREKGARVAVPEARKHLAAYISGFPGAAAARGIINSASDPEEMIRLLRETGEKAENAASSPLDGAK